MEIWFVWLARLMYLGVYLLAAGMAFRAWKIAVAKDLRYVADWRGRAIVNPSRWAAAVLSVNLAGAICLLAIGISVLVVGLPFNLWTGLAALVVWTYYFGLRVVVGRAERGA